MLLEISLDLNMFFLFFKLFVLPAMEDRGAAISLLQCRCMYNKRNKLIWVVLTIKFTKNRQIIIFFVEKFRSDFLLRVLSPMFFAGEESSQTKKIFLLRLFHPCVVYNYQSKTASMRFRENVAFFMHASKQILNTFRHLPFAFMGEPAVGPDIAVSLNGTLHCSVNQTHVCIRNIFIGGHFRHLQHDPTFCSVWVSVRILPNWSWPL